MKTTGKKVNYVITSDQPEYGVFSLCADEGHRDAIESVPGVKYVSNIGNGVDYHIFVDPRYDFETVKINVIEVVDVDSTKNLRSSPDYGIVQLALPSTGEIMWTVMEFLSDEKIGFVPVILFFNKDAKPCEEFLKYFLED
jgi:hypothetical protein